MGRRTFQPTEVTVLTGSPRSRTLYVTGRVDLSGERIEGDLEKKEMSGSKNRWLGGLEAASFGGKRPLRT